MLHKVHPIFYEQSLQLVPQEIHKLLVLIQFPTVQLVQLFALSHVIQLVGHLEQALFNKKYPSTHLMQELDESQVMQLLRVQGMHFP